MKACAQQDVSFSHVQQVLELMPEVAAERGGAANPMLVVQGVSSVAAGNAPHRFFAVLVDDATLVVGYLAGIVEVDVFSNVVVAREVAEYIRPASRNSLARGLLADAFEAWAKERDAARIQCSIPASARGDAYLAAAAERGYVRAAVVMSKEVTRG